ncbi:hypothetical protein TD95_005368 [Thielaviopsis punctulata]|uniref:Prenylcysteine lyase domain-containing protein n=1 Tax=Thielaviopsis punctulata TaxID=72032 RepID=A0A0F4ZKC5_9PEZI|nr:hypothetical protein TD95_005368 [Thielaviopsis punctulata]
MKILLLSSALFAASVNCTRANTDATPQVKNVAIIGAGAGGSSAAYHLRKFADESGVAVNITVFEKSDRIGGRTLTVNAWGNRLIPVELGASIFVEANLIMCEAVGALNLTYKNPELGEDGGEIGVWNGENFVLKEKQDDFTWFDYARLFWRYGLAPLKTKSLVKKTIDRFLKMYEGPHFPFASLNQVAQDLELNKLTGVTGTQFLKANGIGTAYTSDIIQASTRVNYASNLDFIHGLETMVSMAPEGALQVNGGNWKVFARMVEESGAQVFQNTSVTSIKSVEGTDKLTTRYTLSTTDFSNSALHNMADDTMYDEVIIAAPFQFSNIEVADDMFLQPIDQIPYMKLHVTLFATPLRLSSAYFGLKEGEETPSVVLTTLHPSDTTKPGPKGAGKAGFYSISILRQAMNPQTGEMEYLWKIFSPEVVTPEFLSEILGAKVPKLFTGSNNEASPITWYYPHIFYSYPIEYPRVTFQDPSLNKGLWYTSGMESFISTMETSALMGKNVAKLIVDGYTGQKQHSSSKLDEL